MHRRLHWWGHSLSVHCSGDNLPARPNFSFLLEKYLFCFSQQEKNWVSVCWIFIINICPIQFFGNYFLISIHVNNNWSRYVIIILKNVDPTLEVLKEMFAHVCWNFCPVFSVPKSLDKFENDCGACDESTKWANMLSPSCLVYLSTRQERNFDWLILFANVPPFSAIPFHRNSLSFLSRFWDSAVQELSELQTITFDLISQSVQSFIFLSVFYSNIHALHKKNIPRIGKLPYGAKRGFIERKVLSNKGFIEVKAFQNYENWPKFWNLVKIVKFV